MATELALKDHITPWKKGHDIPQLLNYFNDPGLTSLGIQLHNELSAVKCTDLAGNTATVRPEKYPELRYVRHVSDFQGGSSDAQLQSLIRTADDIITQLRSRGVAV